MKNSLAGPIAVRGRAGRPSRLSLLLLTAASSLTTGTLAATLTVSNTHDSGPGSLRDVIIGASPGDEIVFDPSIAGQPITVSTGEIVIDKRLTITGRGRDVTILSGPAEADPRSEIEHRILSILPGTVVSIESLDLVHGRVLLGGGAILNQGDLTIRDCAFNDNISVSGSGGAIRNLGRLVVADTHFEHNYIWDRGYGGGVFNGPSGQAYVGQSSFLSSWTYQGGSGIGNYGYMEAEDCFFNGTWSREGGGAIRNRGTLHLKRSVIQGSLATFAGGGVFNEGVLTISESTIADNYVSTPGRGGGIWNYGTLVLNNSTVHGNSVRPFGGQGGGIFNGGSGGIRGRIVMTNSTVTGNYLNTAEAGGAAGLHNKGTAIIRGNVIAGNFVTDCPGNQAPLGESLRSDWQGSVESLGNNFVGTCTVPASLSCPDRVECSGFHAQDVTGVAIEEIVETAPLRPWQPVSPQVGLLASNGGPTQTVALLTDSPAIDHIPPGECVDEAGDPLLTDQRGISRPQGLGCDVGSFESASPRGTGFWGHQCHGLGYTQVSSEDMHDLFDRVAEASPAFPECLPADCGTLEMTTPRNDMREKAEMSLLGLWLNVVTGRVTRGRPVDLPGLTTAGTVGEAIAEVERTVCDAGASRGDLGTAKEIAEAINNQGEDMEVAALESSATILPGATRTFALAVVNMSPEVRSYDLTVTATWPVTLSASRINGLGPGEIALFTATLFASGASPNQTGEIRVTASDRGSDLPLERTATIRVLVGGQSPPTGGRRLPRVE